MNQQNLLTRTRAALLAVDGRVLSRHMLNMGLMDLVTHTYGWLNTIIVDVLFSYLMQCFRIVYC